MVNFLVGAQIEFLDALLVTNNIIKISGEVGVGKASLHNSYEYILNNLSSKIFKIKI